MNMSMKYILGLVLIMTITNIAFCKVEVEAEEEKFLSMLSYFEEPKQSSYEDFDMYVFSIQWGNTLCLTSETCRNKIANIPKNIFTIHGLWPSYSSGKHITDCNTGKAIPIKGDATELFHKMNTLWLSYTSANESFWSHEFNTHGMCYTNRYNITDNRDYFQFALDLFNKHTLDQLMRQAFGDISGSHQFTLTELNNRFQQVSNLSFDIDCKSTTGKQYLQEVRFYFDLNLQPFRNSKYNTNCRTTLPVTVDFQ